jgi:hypothetical protein
MCYRIGVTPAGELQIVDPADEATVKAILKDLPELTQLAREFRDDSKNLPTVTEVEAPDWVGTIRSGWTGRDSDDKIELATGYGERAVPVYSEADKDHAEAARLVGEADRLGVSRGQHLADNVPEDLSLDAARQRVRRLVKDGLVPPKD